MNALAAGELFVRGEFDAIIFSGGRTAGRHRPSEAAAMHRYLRRHFSMSDVPDSVIVLEEDSIDTAANAEYVAKLLDRRRHAAIALVTTAPHLTVATRLFHNFGLRVNDTFRAEDVLTARSSHHQEFVARYRRSIRARRERAKEAVRRVLLVIDPHGRLLRPVTAALRR